MTLFFLQSRKSKIRDRLHSPIIATMLHTRKTSRMNVFLVSVCILCSMYGAMRVVEHANHGSLHMNTVVRPEATWLLLITNTEQAMNDTSVDRFILELRNHLSDDDCMLHRSKNSVRLIMLVVHCPILESNSRDILHTTSEAIEKTPTLLHTQSYLSNIFGQHNVVVGKNGVSGLKQGYGSAENLETIARGDHTKIVGYTVLSPEEEADLYASQSVQENAGWHLDRISMRFGLLNNEYMYTSDGEGVDVYVMDTGIRVSHTDFEGRATFLHNAVPDRINTDCNGHGTHVAGIIGSRTYGVAKKASIYGVRVLNCSGDGTIDDIIEGIDVIIGHVQSKSDEASRNGVSPRRSVINLSLGGDRSVLIDSMIQNLRDNQITVVIAAGNAASDACRFSPSGMGRDNYVLSVGASDRYDTRPSWSNYGLCVGITAPGADITSTWFTSDTAVKTISGTSMAAPTVAGVVALVLQQNNALSIDEVNRIIVQWATPNIVSGATRAGGGSSLLYSLIDANKPLDTIVWPVPNTDLPITSSATSDSEHRTCSINTLILCFSITILWLTCIM